VKIKSRLRPFQRAGVDQINKLGGVALLADEMGLGKTIQALYWLAEHPEARPAVIVTPAHLKWWWREEAWNKLGLRIAVLNGRKASPIRRTSQCIVCVNYDVLGWVPAKRRAQAMEQGQWQTPWLSVIRRLRPKCIIIEEAHYCKNGQAQRTIGVEILARSCPYRIAVTGTALLNRPIELFPVLNMLWPREFASKVLFGMRYCKPTRTPGGLEYKGASRLPELHRRLKKLGMIRRLKSQVLGELPEKQRSILPVDLPTGTYREAERDFLVWLARQDKKAAERARKVRQMARLGALKRIAAIEKLPLVQQWIEDFLIDTPGKLVVFGIHHAVLRPLHAAFPNSVLIDGATTARKRQAAIIAFQRDPAVRVFFGNIEAAGTGVTLTAASQLLFAELDWVPGRHSQAEDRIHRIGQDRAVQIIYMIARGTIEESLCGLLQHKQKVVSAVLDGRNAKPDLTIYDALLAKLEKRAQT